MDFSHSGAMSQTATRTPVPASASGRVWTTVEGKLRTVEPIGPRRAISSSGRSGRTISRPVSVASLCSFSTLSLRCAKYRVAPWVRASEPTAVTYCSRSTTPVSTSEVPTMSAPFAIRGGPKVALVHSKVLAVTVMPSGASTGIEVKTSTLRVRDGVSRRRATAETGASASSRGPRLPPRRCQRTSGSPCTSCAMNSIVAVPSSTTVSSLLLTRVSSSCT